MPVILCCLPDPTDIVIQGEQTTFLTVCVDTPLALVPLIAGDESFAYPPISGVPTAMIGQHYWYGEKPRQIGPMAFGQAGGVEMLTIGNPAFKSPNIDPIQTWLNAPFPIDITGMWFDLSADLIGPLEVTVNFIPNQGPDRQQADPLEMPVVTIPRGAIFRSGLIKRITAPILAQDFGVHQPEVFNETTSRFLLTGVTKNSSGTPVGGCRVVAFRTTKIRFNPDILANPVVGETTSDGSGNYSIQVSSNDVYQLIAYLPGSPDTAGITVNTVNIINA